MLNSVDKNPQVTISAIVLLIIVLEGQEVSQQVGEVNVVKGTGVEYQGFWFDGEDKVLML